MDKSEQIPYTEEELEEMRGVQKEMIREELSQFTEEGDNVA